MSGSGRLSVVECNQQAVAAQCKSNDYEQMSSFDKGHTLSRTASLDQHIAYIEKLVSSGGPQPSEYKAFDRWLADIFKEHQVGKLSENSLTVLREAFGPALSTQTMQGFALHKPHGYPGDYEIIDNIYRKQTTENPALKRWDQYFHTQTAPTAVRNRKAYFLQLLRGLLNNYNSPSSVPVLNVASGPARDIFEFYEKAGSPCPIFFDCVDSDPKAISYAKRLCSSYLQDIRFQKVNAFRFRSNRNYRLIWSAGLFDYLSDKGFQFLLSNLLSLLTEDGELVIGNFSKNNPTRQYMEVIGDWHLHYRDEQELIKLALGCGIKRQDICIGREPKGVNLFLHIKRGARFLEF